MKNKSGGKFLFYYLIGIGVILTMHLGLISSAEGKDLNVLLISIDTLRPDRLSCYSKEYLETPHIEALAAKGALFERAFAHNPLTLPSHANILLGTTPLYHGIHENSKSVLAEDFFTLAEYLKKKGYKTGAFIGAFPLDSRFGLGQGFDVYDDSYPTRSPYTFVHTERKAREVIRESLDWLKMRNSKWFCFVHIWDPHAPYLPPEPFSEKYKNDLYSGEVAYVDSELGKLFDYLADKDLIENTLIIITGDHGEALGEHGEFTHGYFAYNSTLWVPLIFAGPGIEPVRISDSVGHIDIFPTVCDVLRTEKPSFLQGDSLYPLMRGGKIEKRAIYFESLDPYYNRGWAPLRGFIEGKEKFLDSPLPEYYDLENDFGEENNLIQMIDLEKKKHNLKVLMDRFSSSKIEHGSTRINRVTAKKLKSLGYVSSSATQFKKSYGPDDDLKSLLPFHQNEYIAKTCFEDGRIAEAVKLLSDIIEERKDFTEAYTSLALIYSLQGLQEESLAVLEKGYNNNPGDYGIIFANGIFLIRENRLDEGIEFLEKALAIIDYDPEVWTHLGIAFSKKGEVQKALRCYEKAVSLDETDPLIHNNLGLLYLSIFRQSEKKEGISRAVESFEKAIELDPALISAYNGLGVTHRLMGQIDEAITWWNKALELNPDYDSPIYNLSLAYLEKGDKNRALKCFEKYLLLKGPFLSPEERRKIETYIRKCKE